MRQPISHIVLLPGLDGTGLLFQPFVDALPAGIAATVVRYPGDRHLSYEDLIPLVLSALPRTGPFILLGESFSGPLAILVAAQRPKNLVGVILCASFVTRPWRWIGPVISVCTRLPLFHLYLPYKRMKARLFGYSTAEHRDVLAKLQELVRPHVIACRVRMVFKVDVREALRSCDVPMQYMNGARDIVVPSWNLRTIQQISPKIQVVEFPTSHMVLQKCAAPAARAIADFIASIDASA